MNKTIIGAVAFTVGAAIGSVVSIKFVQKKYERIAQEEIYDMKEYYNQKLATLKEREEQLYSAAKKYGEVLKKVEYDTRSDIFDYEEENEEEPDDDEEDEEPFIIDPDRFDEYEDYDTATLTYYADGTLADDMDEIIDDVDFVVGSDFPKHFGEYADDVVFVRNPTLKVDYEIIRDKLTYETVVGINPHQREVK